jgi:hypothetical protein
MFTISTHRQFNAGGDNCGGGNDADADDKACRLIRCLLLLP